MSRKGGPAEDAAHAFTPDTLNVKVEIDRLIDACDTNDASVFDTFFARVRATILIFDDLDIEVRHMTEEDQATFKRRLDDIEFWKDIILTYKSPPEKTEAERIKYIQKLKTRLQGFEDEKKELAEKTKENFKKQLFECYECAVAQPKYILYYTNPGPHHRWLGIDFNKVFDEYIICKAAKAASPYESPGQKTVLEAILLEKEKDDISVTFFEQPKIIITNDSALAIIDAVLNVADDVTPKYDNVNMLLQYLKNCEGEWISVYHRIFYGYVVEGVENHRYPCLQLLLRHKQDYQPEPKGRVGQIGHLFNAVRGVVSTNQRGMLLVSAMGIGLPRGHFEANPSKKIKLDSHAASEAECTFVDLSFRL